MIMIGIALSVPSSDDIYRLKKFLLVISRSCQMRKEFRCMEELHMAKCNIHVVIDFTVEF